MNKEDFYNAEGYPIPTHYYAVQSIMTAERKRVERTKIYRPMVYICSPFRGDMKGNTEKARQYSRFAVKEGYLPIAPHLLFPQFMDDGKTDERETAIHMGLVLLTKCKELWVFGDEITEGMNREIKKARYRGGIRVRYFTEHMEEKKNG